MLDDIYKRDATHPAEIVREGMSDYGLSVEQLAKDIKVEAQVVSEFIEEKAPMTAELALRLAQYFGTSADVFMTMQKNFDLQIAINEKSDEILREVEPRADLPEPILAILAQKGRIKAAPKPSSGNKKRP